MASHKANSTGSSKATNAHEEDDHGSEQRRGRQINAHHVAKDYVRKSVKKDDTPLFTVKSSIKIDDEAATIRKLFDMYSNPQTNKVPKRDIVDMLEEVGFKIKTDPRLASIAQIPPKTQNLDFDDFTKYVSPSLATVLQAASGQLIVPDFNSFVTNCDQLLHDCENPPIAVAICTIDGQQAGFGQSGEHVCLQELGNCVSYLMARQQLGRDEVHNFIGREYSGARSDEITLSDDHKPHNPLTTIGGLMSCSLINPGDQNSDRYAAIQKTIKRMVAGLGVHFSNEMYSIQRENMFREEAMGFFLKEKNESFDVDESLNLYFQLYSIEMTLESLSILAATIANRGICPITGDQVFSDDVVRDLLAMMYVAGTDLSSGEFAFKVGFPAKNSMAGVVMAIVPGVMGVVTLEEPQETLELITCMDFLIEFSFTFPFGSKAVHSNIDVQPRTSGNELLTHFDPRSTYASVRAGLWSTLVQALRNNDIVETIETLGADVLNMTDFYKRTLLHLAAIDGDAKIIIHLLERGADPEKVDCFGKTAIDYVDAANTSAINAFSADLDVERPVSRGVARMF